MIKYRPYIVFRFSLGLLLLSMLSACGPLLQEKVPRFFWPPPPAEPKVEYINYYFSDDDLQRGVDRRLEYAILGRKPPERLINQPYSVASDGQGRLFIADFSGGILHVYDIPHHSYRKLIAGENGLQKVFVDRSGEIWALNSLKNIVLRFANDETRQADVKLSGVERVASFAVDRSRGVIYVVDSAQHQLNLYDLRGTFLRSIGKRGNQPGEFNFPGDIDLDAAGNLYIVDTMNARIQVLTPDGTPLRTFGERGTARGAFSVPKGIAVSPSGLIYVSDSTQHKLVIFSNEGEFLLTLGARYVYAGGDSGIAPGGFNFPAGLDVDSNETLWIADLFNGMVHEFQYLTPEYLARRPIRADEIYLPKSSDFQQGADDALLPPPIE